MKVLVSAIGSFSADCVIRTLKSLDYLVYGCDIYPAEWHAISKECYNVFRAPMSTNEKEYISFLIQTCQRNKIDVIIPLTDIEIDVIHRNRELFKMVNISVWLQSDICLKIARNKYAMYELFKDDTKVNVPYSISSSQLSVEFPLPAIAKPVNGRSSEGLRIIYELDGLKQLIGTSNYIVQEKINGPVYTVDYVRDSYGNDFAVPREELLRTKNGAGTTIKIVNNSTLIETTSYIGNKIGVIGCVNMEFICSNDKFYLIDINPRFSAGIAFSNFIGYDMVKSHVDSFLNKKIGPPILIKEQIICKRYKEELLTEI